MSRVLAVALAIFIPVASGAQPSLAPIAETSLLSGSPLHIPLDGTDPAEGKLTYTAVSSDPLVSATILEGNRSIRMKVGGFGDLVFELFDARAPRATNRVVALADGGFYDGVIFHRVIDTFVIQGGDPTGTGTGGSTLGNFDDQFHVDLQHNRTGLLSMAKSNDDTNDSQFFITEGPQRHLDFNHSIFGILVEGEDVRDRISAVPVGANDRPVNNVVMETVRSFVDDQNAVLMLKAPEGATGAVDVTVAVTNERGQEARQTFRVQVTPDVIDSPPFLADIPELTTKVDTPLTYQLQAIDVEENGARYLDQDSLSFNGLPAPVVTHADLRYIVDFDTGLLTIGPTNGLTGRHLISVATATSVDAIDYQVIAVVIEP